MAKSNGRKPIAPARAASGSSKGLRAKSKVPPELAEALRLAKETLPTLTNIAQLHVCRFVSDASTVIRSGAILLGIATVKDDKDGDGFRILVGLPRGTEITGYLSNYFEGYVGSVA